MSENLSRAITKPLWVTQIEEKALEELRQFYNVDRCFDENVTIARLDQDRIMATPIWKKNLSSKKWYSQVVINLLFGYFCWKYKIRIVHQLVVLIFHRFTIFFWTEGRDTGCSSHFDRILDWVKTKGRIIGSNKSSPTFNT